MIIEMLSKLAGRNDQDRLDASKARARRNSRHVRFTGLEDLEGRRAPSAFGPTVTNPGEEIPTPSTTIGVINPTPSPTVPRIIFE